MKYVKVYAPATIANFGPGFDVFGTSVDALGDVVEIRESEEIIVEVEGYRVPLEVEKNVAVVAALALEKFAGEKTGFRMKIRKGIPPGSGLGSSGASSLGGALAMAQLLNVNESRIIIQAALEGERIASGSPHGDNVIPAYYGGFVIINSVKPLDVVKLNVSMDVAIVLPEIEINTMLARELLPEKIPIGDAVKNVAMASSLVTHLLKRDVKKIAQYLRDYIAFPYRKTLYPWFEKVEDAALDAGAYAVFISGSGPALFALGENLREVAKAMVEEFESLGIKSGGYVSKTGGRARCI